MKNLLLSSLLLFSTCAVASAQWGYTPGYQQGYGYGYSRGYNPYPAWSSYPTVPPVQMAPPRPVMMPYINSWTGRLGTVPVYYPNQFPQNTFGF